MSINSETKSKNKHKHAVIDIADSEIPEELNDIRSDESTKVQSQKLKQYVIKYIVQPAYVADIKDTIEWRYRWLRCSRSFRWIAHLFLLVSGILASLQTIDSSKWCSIGVITCNTLVFLLHQFSTDAKSESKAMTDEVNKYLSTLEITGVPELTSSETIVNDTNTNTNTNTNANTNIIAKINNSLSNIESNIESKANEQTPLIPKQ
jgi:hypothetical protein